MLRKIDKEFWLVIFALSWIVLINFLCQIPISNSVVGDEGSFLQAALKLYNQQLPSDDRPFLIAAIQGFPLLFNFPVQSVYIWSFIINCVCWILSSLLIFKICKIRVGEKWAFAASLLFLLCIGNLAINFKLLSEPIYIFFILGSLFFINSFYCKKQIKFLLLGIVVLTLSILIKPLSMGLLVLVLIACFKKWKSLFFNRLSILLFLSFGLLFFQMQSMKSQYGNYTVSYIDAFTYYNYLGTRADCLKNKSTFKQGENERYRYFLKLPSSEQKKVAQEDLVFQIRYNLPNLIQAYFTTILINSSKGSASIHALENNSNTFYFDFFQYSFKVITKLQNCILTLFGFLLSMNCLVRFKKDGFLSVVAVAFFYILFVSGISSDQGDRFHIVLYPLVLILFASFLNRKFIH